jgi:hypothetical protein
MPIFLLQLKRRPDYTIVSPAFQFTDRHVPFKYPNEGTCGRYCTESYILTVR